MTRQAKESENESSLDHSPIIPASSAPIVPPPPGSGEQDETGAVRPQRDYKTWPNPVQTSSGPRHPMMAPVRNPMAPKTQETPDEETTDDEFVVPEYDPDVQREAPISSPPVQPKGPVLTEADAVMTFMPDVPDASEEVRKQRAADDPITITCDRCGLPYGSFQLDPFTGKRVHRFMSECVANARRPHPFVEGAVPATVQFPAT